MKSFVANIEKMTEENDYFRRVLYTGHAKWGHDWKRFDSSGSADRCGRSELGSLSSTSAVSRESL